MQIRITEESQLCDLVEVLHYAATRTDTGEVVTVYHDTDWDMWYIPDDIMLDRCDNEDADLFTICLHDVSRNCNYGIDLTMPPEDTHTILRFDDRFSDIWCGVINHLVMDAYDEDEYKFRLVADRQDDGSLIIVYYTLVNGEWADFPEEEWDIICCIDNWEEVYYA